MNTNKITYYFGRLNMISCIKKEDKPSYLYNSLKINQKIKERNFVWGFFDIEILDYGNMKYYFGYLVKYKKESNEEIVDNKNNTITNTTIEDKAIAKAQFFLEPKSGIIAFHPVPNKINDNQFRKKFGELIEKANENIFIDAEIQIINDEMELFKTLKQFDKITSLAIELHPSNPSNRERWKKTDERLQEMRVETYKQHYYSSKGLEINENGEAFGDIIMAGDGYGRAEIEGIIDDEEKNVSTEKKPLKTKGLNSENPLDILKSIINKFSQVKDRMLK